VGIKSERQRLKGGFWWRIIKGLSLYECFREIRGNVFGACGCPTVVYCFFCLSLRAWEDLTWFFFRAWSCLFRGVFCLFLVVTFFYLNTLSPLVKTFVLYLFVHFWSFPLFRTAELSVLVFGLLIPGVYFPTRILHIR